MTPKKKKLTTTEPLELLHESSRTLALRIDGIAQAEADRVNFLSTELTRLKACLKLSVQWFTRWVLTPLDCFIGITTLVAVLQGWWRESTYLLFFTLAVFGRLHMGKWEVSISAHDEEHLENMSLTRAFHWCVLLFCLWRQYDWFLFTGLKFLDRPVASVLTECEDVESMVSLNAWDVVFGLWKHTPTITLVKGLLPLLHTLLWIPLLAWSPMARLQYRISHFEGHLKKSKECQRHWKDQLNHHSKELSMRKKLLASEESETKDIKYKEYIDLATTMLAAHDTKAMQCQRDTMDEYVNSPRRYLVLAGISLSATCLALNYAFNLGTVLTLMAMIVICGETGVRINRKLMEPDGSRWFKYEMYYHLVSIPWWIYAIYAHLQTWSQPIRDLLKDGDSRESWVTVVSFKVWDLLENGYEAQNSLIPPLVILCTSCMAANALRCDYDTVPFPGL